MCPGANETLLTKDGSRTLNCERYGETYHSVNGALTEARYVFLNATGVTQRLEAGTATNVLEIGFGLGLNTLLSADLAYTHRASLNYHAFENELVSAQTLDELGHAKLLVNPLLAGSLRDFVASVHEHAAKTHLASDITLTLHLQDASTVNFKQQFNTRFHAIFLDAFSPDTNAECWSPEFISNLAQALTSGGKLSTYSAKGAVRRAMLAARLTVTKRSGPPGNAGGSLVICLLLR